MANQVLLLGYSGQLGYELTQRLLRLAGCVVTDIDADHAGLAVRQLDIADLDAVRLLIRSVQPSVVINATAYTAVDRAEDEEPIAMRINADAPQVMAEAAKEIGAALIHYSTDYLFRGDGDKPSVETDLPAPQNAYGRSKLAGEEAIRAVNGDYWIFRTSWVFSYRGVNFVRTMLRLGNEREQLSIVDDQIGSPTSALSLAELTIAALSSRDQDWRTRIGETRGIYHLTNLGEVSWYRFAERIFQLARERGIPLRVKQLIPIRTADYPTPAKRPHNSRLSKNKFINTFGITPLNWEDALVEVMDRLAGLGGNG